MFLTKIIFDGEEFDDALLHSLVFLMESSLMMLCYIAWYF